MKGKQERLFEGVWVYVSRRGGGQWVLKGFILCASNQTQQQIFIYLRMKSCENHLVFGNKVVRLNKTFKKKTIDAFCFIRPGQNKSL